MRLWKFLKRSSATDWLLVAFTFVLAVVAIFQGAIIKGQLRVMREDERAWIVLSEQKGKEPRVVFDPVIKTAVVIKNTGKTPARRVFANLTLEVVEDGQLPVFRPPPDASSSVFIVGSYAPQNPVVIPIDRWRTKESEPWVTSADEKKALMNGTAWIAVFGNVAYEDVFGVHHWLHWCSWANPVGKGDRAAVCAAYNDQDFR